MRALSFRLPWSRARKVEYPGLRALTRLVDAVLLEEARPRIAVLASGRRTALATALAKRYPAATVTGADVSLASWRVWSDLAGSGPLDLLVDLSEQPAAQVASFCAYFQHLREGGRYAVPACSEGTSNESSHPLRSFIDRLGTRNDGVEPALRRALTDALGDVEETRSGLVVTRRGGSLALLREREVNRALVADPSRGRVVARVPRVTFTSRCEFRSSTPDLPRRAAANVRAPAMFLRDYRDVYCAPRSLVVQRNVVAPDSFRHAEMGTLAHVSLQPAGPRFSREPFQKSAALPLEGTFFHLDNVYRGHFGHALTDQVSRLWAWPQAKEATPELRVLLGASAKFPFAAWERTLLSAAGIDDSDIEIIEGPVHVQRLLSARPMFAMPRHVHPEIVHTWDRIGAALRSQAPERAYPARIFIARRAQKRVCENAPEVEALFGEHGFEVVFPEEHPLPVQARMFHEAELIAGFAGSGLFGVIFTDRPKHLIVLNPSSYRANNEYLIAAVRGHRLDLVVCQSSIAQTPGQPVPGAKDSPFRCDMQREGAWLRERLRSLGP